MLPSKGKTMVKTISGLYLWYKYSCKTTYGDLTKMWDNQKSIRSELARSTKFMAFRSSESRSYELPTGPMEIRYHAKVVLDNRHYAILNRIVNWLDSIGLAPTTANMWDLIPFSFVVDWFTGTGDLLGDVDQWLGEELNRYPLRVRTYSYKSSVKLSLDPTSFGWVLDTDLVYTRFQRSVHTSFPKNRFEFGRVNPAKHFFELLALVVANW